MEAIINTYKNKNPIHSSKHLKGVSKLALVSHLALELIDNFYYIITTRGMSPFLIKKKCPIISSNYGYAIVHTKISSQTQNKEEKKKIRKWEGIYACRL